MSGLKVAQLMLPEGLPRVKRLVWFAEEDWDLLEEVFDENHFRPLIVGVLTRGYCEWLRSKGIESKEQRISSGLKIEDFILEAGAKWIEGKKL